MTKYSIVLPAVELDGFLSSLQNLGLMDITRKSRPFDQDSTEMFETSARFKRTTKLVKASDNTVKADTSGLDTSLRGKEMLADVEKRLARITAVEKLLAGLRREAEFAAPWGDFNKKDIDRIAALGYSLAFYTIPEKKYNPEWENEYAIQILNRYSGRVYFTVVSPAGETPSLKLNPTKLPDYSYAEYQEKISALEAELGTLKGNIAYYAENITLLEEGLADHLTELEMYLAKDATASEGEGCISILEGFAPTAQDGEITAFLDSNEVLYLKDAAKEEDNPPVKLKNNAFAKLFEPIGDLYMLPKYGELDLTPYFAPFYMLFFGLCLGDIGYGLVLIIAGMIAKWKAPAFKGYASLVQLLGFGSVIMPLLSGTFFGLSLGEEIPSLSELFLSPIEMFWFAIIFGIFQIVFAKVLRAISVMKMKGFIYGLANIGWALLITAASFAYASMEGNNVLPSSVVTGLAIGGAALILFFSKTEGNIFVRVIKGVTSFWDITGVFGDVLSYIRLFGLGTSGGILGLVVNSVAGEMFGIPYVGWLFGGLMLLIGHTAVLFLSSLGAFVHPMRLTFIEFYKNAEFEGGGRAFRPFKKGKEK